MEKETFFQKVNRRAWYEIRKRLKGKVYLLSYRSYWHYLLNKGKSNEINTSCYYAARPNIGAGIGHQLANWIAGYWFAKQFSLSFAHIPFSTDRWENFLGFGENEAQYYHLKEQGYKVRRLPLFDEKIEEQINITQSIINSYSGANMILLATQDQFYRNQYGVMDTIRNKFYSAPSRKNNQIKYCKDYFNIAVHVRRTVVIENKIILEDEETKAKRWLSNDYYENVLKQILPHIKIDKPIAIWLFSTGKPEEFEKFKQFGEIHFCSDMDEYQSFAHLIYADLLITSKSSFSYKPALMNTGIKVCPRSFWHGYPDTKDWILCENDGTFDIKKLKEAGL